MKNLISLRLKIYLILTSFVFVTLLGAGVMFWYTFKIEGVLNNLIKNDIAAFQSAEALESALVNQKGFVTYYFLDRDPDWLRQLGEYRQIFKQRLNDTKELSEEESQKKIVNSIEKEYNVYIELKDKVIAYYKAGEYEKGAKLHKEVRKRFSAILNLCNEYKNLHNNRIIQAEEESHNEAVNLRFFSITGLFTITVLVIVMAFVLVNNILRPVHRLIIEAGREGKSGTTDG
ncbi:MAG: MCP four helix bundle domain-containing protein, partial [Proteobacteria bacterium]|nr:MCP four helix bundle domain-containing protein [Pseudomonadota bacterium]MBU1571230.1 MCP four helix bundle domain-containing protein [Pseudomonadota bacterium]